MPKVVHVVRHAQAEHNVSHVAELRRNTSLTATGRMQLVAARAHIRNLVPRPEVVLSSPVLRALQTTNGVAPEMVPRVVVTDARERVANPEALCELPMDRTRLRSPRLSFAEFDWTGHDSAMAQAGSVEAWEAAAIADDYDHEAEGECKKRIKKRARRLTSYIEARPEQTLLLVSHGGFLMYLTKDEYMDNCEVRSYTVQDGRWRRSDAIH